MHSWICRCDRHFRARKKRESLTDYCNSQRPSKLVANHSSENTTTSSHSCDEFSLNIIPSPSSINHSYADHYCTDCRIFGFLGGSPQKQTFESAPAHEFIRSVRCESSTYRLLTTCTDARYLSELHDASTVPTTKAVISRPRSSLLPTIGDLKIHVWTPPEVLAIFGDSSIFFFFFWVKSSRSIWWK